MVWRKMLIAQRKLNNLPSLQRLFADTLLGDAFSLGDLARSPLQEGAINSIPTGLQDLGNADAIS